MNATKLVIALLLGLSTAGFASQAMAQSDAKRDAAMQKCLDTAGQIVGETQQQARASAYKACMTKAGFKP